MRPLMLLVAVPEVLLAFPAGSAAAECLASGICLPSQWPPTIAHSHTSGGQSTLPPYLLSPPKTINVSTGRQLFVDSFLVDEGKTHGVSTLYHQPVYRDDVNPVLRPTEKWEFGFDSKGERKPSMDFATPYSGGLWWDPPAKHYKFWYSCGSPDGLGSGVTCLATSPVLFPRSSWRQPAHWR